MSSKKQPTRLFLGNHVKAEQALELFVKCKAELGVESNLDFLTLLLENIGNAKATLDNPPSFVFSGSSVISSEPTDHLQKTKKQPTRLYLGKSSKADETLQLFGKCKAESDIENSTDFLIWLLKNVEIPKEQIVKSSSLPYVFPPEILPFLTESNKEPLNTAKSITIKSSKGKSTVFGRANAEVVSEDKIINEPPKMVLQEEDKTPPPRENIIIVKNNEEKRSLGARSHPENTGHEMELINQTPETSIMDNMTEGILFQCVQCLIYFPEHQLLIQHSETHKTAPKKPYMCNLCSKDFDECTELKMHMSEHSTTGKKPFRCGICGRCYSIPEVLERHLEIHLDDQSFVCTVCEKKFLRLQTYEKHILTHKSLQKLFLCEVCDKKFTKAENFEKHIRTHISDTTQETLQCGNCREFVKDPGVLIRHSRSHIGANCYKCKLCDEDFANGDEFEDHVCPYNDVATDEGQKIDFSPQLNTEEKSHNCDVCDEEFTNLGALQKHGLSHTDKIYDCKFCNKKFADMVNMERHSLTHAGEKPYLCDYCGVTFAESAELQKHVRQHTGIKSFECKKCLGTFSTSANYKRHSCKDRQHKCDTCGKGFSNGSNLLIHTRIHTGEKPYSCEYCEKRFNNIYHMRTHTRTHTGEKPYKCDHCTKTFGHPSNLQRHQRFHTGEKPYKCTHCERGFVATNDLKRHIRIHTGEKPFHCDVCGKSFTNSSNFQRHHQRHRPKDKHEPKPSSQSV
eukprot:TCONS_00012440-protein